MTCTRCELHTRCQSICIPGRGSSSPKILLIGEAPGPEEDRLCQPFVGVSGQLLDELLKEAGIPLQDVHWSNVVRCFPGWTTAVDGSRVIAKPHKEHLQACLPYLWGEITKTRPAVLVLAGRVAFEAFFGQGSIMRERGRPRLWRIPTDFAETIRAFTSSEVLTREIPVVPTWHPAYVLRNKGRHAIPRQQLIDDLTLARQIAYGEVGKQEKDYRILRSLDELQAYVADVLAAWRAGTIPGIAVDVEADSLHPFCLTDELLTIQMCVSPGCAVLLPIRHPESSFGDSLSLRRIASCLTEIFAEVPVLGQNVKFDAHWIYNRLGVSFDVAFDTMLAHQMLYSGTRLNDLKSMAARYVGMAGYEAPFQVARGRLPKEQREKPMRFLPLSDLVEYGCGDADATFRLASYLRSELERENLWPAYCLLVLGTANFNQLLERNGLFVDRSMLRYLLSSMPGELDARLSVIRESRYWTRYEAVVGSAFSPASPQQKAKMLYEVMGLPIIDRTETGMGKTDKETLTRLAALAREQVPPLMEEARIVDTLLVWSVEKRVFNSYIENMAPMLADEVSAGVHPSFDLAGTVTGRVSAKEPAIHNVPRGSKARWLFASRFRSPDVVAGCGVLLASDFSQMELRVFAMLSADLEFERVFRGGGDLHRFVASALLGKPMEKVTKEERQLAKTQNFGILYGRGDQAVAEDAHCSLEQAAAFREMYFSRFKGVAEWIRETERAGLRDREVTTVFGRRRLLPMDVYTDDECKRRAVNTLIQSPASDITLLSAVRVSDQLSTGGLKSLVICIIHDSIMVDVYPGEVDVVARLLRREMIEWIPSHFDWARKVPLAVDLSLGADWGHLLHLEEKPDGWLLADDRVSFPPAYERLAACLAPVGDVEWGELEMPEGKDEIRVHFRLGVPVGVGVQ